MSKTYEPQEIRLANEIADELNDRQSLQLFLNFSRKYREDHLRKILAKVMSIPDRQIKKTRGALFTYLVHQHDSDYSGDQLFYTNAGAGSYQITLSYRLLAKVTQRQMGTSKEGSVPVQPCIVHQVSYHKYYLFVKTSTSSRDKGV